jgi:hypothetical protein
MSDMDVDIFRKAWKVFEDNGYKAEHGPNGNVTLFSPEGRMIDVYHISKEKSGFVYFSTLVEGAHNHRSRLAEESKSA